jgi:hypothetical protein
MNGLARVLLLRGFRENVGASRGPSELLPEHRLRKRLMLDEVNGSIAVAGANATWDKCNDDTSPIEAGN